MVRINAKPIWYKFISNLCVICGNSFTTKEKILNGEFCIKCGTKKEKELKLRNPDLKMDWYEFSQFCVQCSAEFKKEDEILFGLYCKKCGKKWIKNRELRQPKLKKARNLEARPETILKTITQNEKSPDKSAIRNKKTKGLDRFF